jgi:hypothetical protein
MSKLFQYRWLSLLWMGLIATAAPAAELPATEFDEMYADVAAYVLEPSHSPDLAHGVVEIEYGDAKAYFPAWVYVRDRLPGAKPAAFEFEIARAMHQRYRRSFETISEHPLKIFQDLNAAMDAAIGIEGILRAYEHDASPEYHDLARRYLEFAKLLARRPGLLMGYHMQPYGPATVLAGGAWFYLEYARAAGPDDPDHDAYERLGLSLIEKMDRQLYSEKKHAYRYSCRPGYDFIYVYDNAVMVQALTRAYVLTGERRYYDRALAVMNTLEQALDHPAYGGFLAAEENSRYRRQYEKVGPQYNREYMALSAHNYLVYAYLSLYEAGGFQDEELLAKAAKCLRFERDRLWDRRGKIQHHLERGKISEPKDYCMGCNFQTLYHIVQYKAALLKIPTQGLSPATSHR